MTDTSALRAFLEARLAEDERHARKDLAMLHASSNGGDWSYGVGYNLRFSELGEDGSIGRLTATYGRRLADGEYDQHAADVMIAARLVRTGRRRAERVLREVAYKRRVLQFYQDLTQVVTEVDGLLIAPGMRRIHAEHRVLLAAMASVWSDHPDYRTEWNV